MSSHSETEEVFLLATYGYIRVSSKEQNEARQVAALGGWDILPENLVMDKQSGKDFERPGWLELMDRLEQGDLLVVQSIDRLGRNYTEILEWWRMITKEIQADILVLDMPLLDTRAKDNDLTGTFVADLVLQILSYVAQTERENIRKRQAEGIAAAKARGVQFGPDRVPPPSRFVEAREAYRAGVPLRDAARMAGMKNTTFYRECQRVGPMEARRRGRPKKGCQWSDSINDRCQGGMEQ